MLKMNVLDEATKVSNDSNGTDNITSNDTFNSRSVSIKPQILIQVMMCLQEKPR